MSGGIFYTFTPFLLLSRHQQLLLSFCSPPCSLLYRRLGWACLVVAAVEVMVVELVVVVVVVVLFAI